MLRSIRQRFVVVNFFRSYSNRFLVILIRSSKLASFILSFKHSFIHSILKCLQMPQLHNCNLIIKKFKFFLNYSISKLHMLKCKFQSWASSGHLQWQFLHSKKLHLLKTEKSHGGWVVQDTDISNSTRKYCRLGPRLESCLEWSTN